MSFNFFSSSSRELMQQEALGLQLMALHSITTDISISLILLIEGSSF